MYLNYDLSLFTMHSLRLRHQIVYLWELVGEVIDSFVVGVLTMFHWIEAISIE